MNCIFCGSDESKVLDSRDTNNGQCIRRRRMCLNCGKRYTTYEQIELVPILIIKRDHSREPYSREKLKTSLIKCTQKRSVSNDLVERIVDDIEKEIYSADEQEITSTTIGEMVLRKLKYIDEISFVRYAITFKKFNRITEVIEYLNRV